NGSVWPHDNALIALGMSRYGFVAEACRVMEGLFQASLFVDSHRLPELFCGFARRPGESPTLYPVACNPQAWASASIYMLVEARLGLSIDSPAGQVRLEKPALPPFLDELRITGLRVGAGSVDLTLRRHGGEVTVEIPMRSGKVEVIESIRFPPVRRLRTGNRPGCAGKPLQKTSPRPMRHPWPRSRRSPGKKPEVLKSCPRAARNGKVPEARGENRVRDSRNPMRSGVGH